MTMALTAPFGPIPLRAARWTPEDAGRLCVEFALEHYENFPVVFAMLSREARDALAAIYAFARIADDFADEPAYEGLREQLLDGWEAQLRHCLDPAADLHPVFLALAGAIRRYDLPLQAFLDLLSAFRQDCRAPVYQTTEQLLDYCRRSANPVGRLVLRVFGAADPRLDALSDRLCTALQLTNFWQDLSVDLPRGREYLPDEDLAQVGLSRDVLHAPDEALDALVRLECERTSRLFAESRALLTEAPARSRPYLALVWLGGRTVLAMVSALGARGFRQRPSLSAGFVARWAVATAWRLPHGRRSTLEA